MASATRGHRVCVVSWPLPPSTRVIGALLAGHGYGHYAAPIYDWLATTLGARGYALLAVEHVGHGKSEGLRGFVPSFDALVEDVLRVASAARVRELPAGTPLFLYGESLGGAICQHAALRAPRAFSGLVLLAPMTGLAAGIEPHPLIVTLGRAAAWLAPAAPLAPVTDIVPKCFRNATVVEAARADPFRYAGRMRLGTAFELKGAMEVLAARGAELDTPLIIFHGSGDLVCAAAASAALLTACAARDKTHVLLEGAWHVLWAEPADTRARMLADLTAWLDDRCLPERRAAKAAEARAAAAAAAGAASAHTSLHRPLGVEPWGGDPAAETTPYTLATHRHLYEATRPEGEYLRLDDAEHHRVLADMPPRIESDAAA